MGENEEKVDEARLEKNDGEGDHEDDDGFDKCDDCFIEEKEKV